MTLRIVIDPHPCLVDRIAAALLPWLNPAPPQNQHQPPQPEAGT
jgi:hypothetical protein